MTDYMIPRDAAHEEAFMDAVWAALKADATDLGKQRHILTALRAIPAIDPAAIREAALREAAAVIIDIRGRHGVMPSRYEIMPQRWREAILALINKEPTK